MISENQNPYLFSPREIFRYHPSRHPLCQTAMGSYVIQLKAAQLSPDLKPCECEPSALGKGLLSTGLQQLSAKSIQYIGFGPIPNPDREGQVERAQCICLLDQQNQGQPWRLSAI